VTLVSIVTTSYNQAAFLEETIHSVLGQDHERLEYVVVDDGSTDESTEIVRRYAHRFAWWTLQENRGQAAALNRGFSHARGDVLGFLSSDDTLLSGAVSKVAVEFERDPDLLVVYGDVHLTDEHGQRTGYSTSLEWDPGAMTRRAWGPHQQAAFWSRRAWELAGPFDEDAWGLFDVQFFLRLVAVGRAHHLHEPLATLRLHPDSKQMSRRATMAEDYLRLADGFYATGLPATLRRWARTGRATLYRRAALHFQAAGETARARRLFLRSLVLSLRGIERKQLRRLARTLVKPA
jgi:glycosyltransferase involved in cell wall biosynthesis